MSNIKIGSLVTRKSYGCDLLFKVKGIGKNKNGKPQFILQGVDYRLEADAEESDLKMVSEEEVQRYSMQFEEWIEKSIENIMIETTQDLRRTGREDSFYFGGEVFEKRGRVLHLEGAKDFIDKCSEHYKKVGIEAVVVMVPEKEQPFLVEKLLWDYQPDILVLTGHDGMIKNNSDCSNIYNYKNSIYFVNAVKNAREYEKSLDNLVIFAGACQSNYEAILNAGANFSSSPKRVFIHMFDPVIVAEKVAVTNIDRSLSVIEIAQNTSKGFDGVGGIQTRGKSRLVGPKITSKIT